MSVQTICLDMDGGGTLGQARAHHMSPVVIRISVNDDQPTCEDAGAAQMQMNYSFAAALSLSPGFVGRSRDTGMYVPAIRENMVPRQNWWDGARHGTDFPPGSGE